MPQHPSRRAFVRTSAAAGAVFSLGDLSLLCALPVPQPEADWKPNRVQFEASIEPLVQLLETTSRSKLLPAFAKRIRAGTSYTEILSALRDKGDLSEESVAAIASFRSLTGQQLDKVEWCITNGYLVEAKEKLNGMLKGLKGAGALHARAKAIAGRIDSPELEAELNACKKLNRILKRIHADGFGKKDANKKALEKLAKSIAGTMAAKRAEHLIAL